MRVKKKICVIDDDEIYQMIMKRLIGKVNVFEGIQQFCKAIAALEELKDLSRVLPDVILLDINMPEMDGWQFIEELRKERPGFEKETKVYIVTSSIAQSDRTRARSYTEITDFLSKPIKVHQLRSIAENL
ncbi:response regulator [Autumnicola edwardsiae]|uniref:Response regulator n=1 Tax=Autumnicola edwardsiae TaxID=3075594 RepID=A0ABU3CVT9_9FLAO|nr:response regulator [Zunongwangia sp. F297]MDT0650478.1 response regulator [Zunongwangia sp. F297]